MFYNGFCSPNPGTSPAHCLTPAPSSYTVYNSSHPPFGIKVPAQVVTSRRYVFEVFLRVNPRVIAPRGGHRANSVRPPRVGERLLIFGRLEHANLMKLEDVGSQCHAGGQPSDLSLSLLSVEGPSRWWSFRFLPFSAICFSIYIYI